MRDREALVLDLARQTGRRIPANDPIIDLATLNRIMLDEALDEFQRAVKDAVDRMSVASTQQIDAALAAAKIAAAALINDAGDWATDRIRTVLEEGTAKLRGELVEIKAQVERNRRASAWFAAASLAGFVLTVVAAIAWYWTA